MGRIGRFRLAGCMVLAWLLVCVARAAEDETVAVEARIAAADRHLASDELEGRGLNTRGLEQAAEYIAQQFTDAGLQTDHFAGRPFQEFPVTAGAEMGPDNRVSLAGPASAGGAATRIEWKVERDFLPLALSGTQTFDLPLVFAGYGITSNDPPFDEYAGLDVRCKAVILLRHEPPRFTAPRSGQWGNYSQHALFRRKIANALEHGAAAVVFCTDEPEILQSVGEARRDWYQAVERVAQAHARHTKAIDPTLDQLAAQRREIEDLMTQARQAADKLQAQSDPLLPFGGVHGEAPAREIPILHVRRAKLDALLSAAAGVRLADLEHAINQGPSLHAMDLPGWRISGRTDVRREKSAAKNVLGMLPGKGPLAEETLVIGAHYDHLGHGGFGSLAPGVNAIHHGADDNASGVAALLEIARQLSAHRATLQRRVVFIAFSGEERGLLGSQYYVAHPLVPLRATVAMLNLDMVGRLRDDRLTVMGSGTAAAFDGLLSDVNRTWQLQLNRVPDGFGPSDQMSFALRQIPVLFFFTGMHADYHRPSDTFDKINVPGTRRVALFARDVAMRLAGAEPRPQYLAVKPSGDAVHGAGGAIASAPIEATPAAPTARAGATSRAILAPTR